MALTANSAWWWPPIARDHITWRVCVSCTNFTAAFSLAVLTPRPAPSPGLQLAPRDPQPPPR